MDLQKKLVKYKNKLKHTGGIQPKFNFTSLDESLCSKLLNFCRNHEVELSGVYEKKVNSYEFHGAYNTRHINEIFETLVPQQSYIIEDIIKTYIIYYHCFVLDSILFSGLKQYDDKIFMKCQYNNDANDERDNDRHMYMLYDKTNRCFYICEFHDKKFIIHKLQCETTILEIILGQIAVDINTIDKKLFMNIFSYYDATDFIIQFYYKPLYGQEVVNPRGLPIACFWILYDFIFDITGGEHITDSVFFQQNAERVPMVINIHKDPKHDILIKYKLKDLHSYEFNVNKFLLLYVNNTVYTQHGIEQIKSYLTRFVMIRSLFAMESVLL